MSSPPVWSSRFGLSLGVAILAVLCCGCDRHVRVTKEMTWECAPEQRDPAYPDAEPVMFRYLEDRRFFHLQSGRGLCRQLQASGKATATVVYNAWGGPLQKLHGFSIDSINGLPLQDVGGPGRAGFQGMDSSAPHPLAKALDEK